MSHILDGVFFTRRCQECDGRGTRFTWKGGGRGADGRGIGPRWDEKWETCRKCHGAGRVTLSQPEAREFWRITLKYGSRLAAVAAVHWFVFGVFAWCALMVWRRGDRWPLLFALVGLWTLCEWVSGHYFRDDEPRVHLGCRIAGPLKFASARQRKHGAWNLGLAVGWVVGLVWGGIPGSLVPLTVLTLVGPVALMSALIYGLSRE